MSKVGYTNAELERVHIVECHILNRLCQCDSGKGQVYLPSVTTALHFGFSRSDFMRSSIQDILRYKVA